MFDNFAVNAVKICVDIGPVKLMFTLRKKGGLGEINRPF